MTPDSPLPDVLTIKEAAVIMRCSKAHVANVLNGRVANVPPMPYVPVGRRKLILRASLQRWMKGIELHAQFAEVAAK